MAKDNEAVNPEPQIEETPTPQISETQAGQPYDQAGDSGADLESLRAMVREELQSVKDTRIGKSETRLDNLEAAISQYEAEKGGTVDAKALSTLQGVQREKDLLSRIEALEGGKAVTPSAGSGRELLTEKQASILSEVGLSAKDPRFVEFLRDNPKFKSNEEYFEALDKKALEWQSADAKKPQPSASTVAQTIPSVPAGDGSYTKDKYVEDMNKARGNKAELQRVKAAARADGVDVDNIGFI